MRVLVTGNLGYIGPVVTRRLREAGHTVIGVDTGWYLGDYAGDPVWPNVQYFGDIREPENHWWTGIDAAVHLAGLSNDPIGDLDPELTQRINYEGTVAMLVPGARNVVVSSCSVYGDSHGVAATEGSTLRPLTEYARAKASVDNWMRNFADASSEWAPKLDLTNWASLRLGTVWGYSPGHRLDLVVNRMVYDATYGKAIHARGDAARPIVHVEDVADAIVHFVGRKDTGIYNIVGENVTIAPLAERVAAAVGAEYDTFVPVVYEDGGADQRDYAALGDKAALAGWTPNYLLDDALADLVIQTATLPEGRLYERLPIARKHLEAKAA